MIELMYDEVLQETGDAVLIEFEPGVQYWLPTSQCGLRDGDTIEVKRWLVEEKELEVYAYDS